MVNNPRLHMGYVVRMFPRFSETFVLHEILALERQGVDVTIFSLRKPDEGRFHPALSRLKAPVIYLDDVDPKKWWSWMAAEWSSLEPGLPHLWQLLEAAIPSGNSADVDLVFTSAWLAVRAKKSGVDALHAHFATVASTAASHSGRIAGIPYSFTAHAKDIFTDSVDRIELAEKINGSRFVVTVSQFNRQFLSSSLPLVDAGRIRVLYNGVDLEYFSPAEHRDRNAAPLILSVGRLVAKKGFDDLIAACSLLKEAGTPFHCIIVGQGREEPKLRAQINAAGLESDVELVGALTQDAVRDLMFRSTVFCLPCRRADDGNQDALPTVLLEALACGVPVISTRLSGIPEIIEDESDGVLVNPGAVPELAVMLERLLKSPEIRLRLARNGRRKAESTFDIRQNVATLRTWFAEGLDNSGDGARSADPLTTRETGVS